MKEIENKIINSISKKLVESKLFIRISYFRIAVTEQNGFRDFESGQICKREKYLQPLVYLKRL